MNAHISLFVILLGWAGANVAIADPASLQNATATFSQEGFPVSAAIDGDSSSTTTGWAIGDVNTGETNTQTAAFQFTDVQNSAAGFGFTITLYQNYNDPPYLQHTLGCFRLSFTGDDQAAFADGLANGGNVTANWTVATITGLSATNGVNLNLQGDGSVLASGPNPATSVYTVAGWISLPTLTGLRLEALEDPSLPTDGPGRAVGGNFVLTELTVDVTAVPEPATYALLFGAASLLAVVWKRASLRRAAAP